VKINEKNIEVIFRQMPRRVQIVEAGDAGYIIGEQVEHAAVSNLPATYERVLLSTTKSLLSPASFQETTRVLTKTAIMGNCDGLRGLKEHIIACRLIPGGTGSAFHPARI
jgi:DNA-directed RNA polymerase subunit beta'